MPDTLSHNAPTPKHQYQYGHVPLHYVMLCVVFVGLCACTTTTEDGTTITVKPGISAVPDIADVPAIKDQALAGSVGGVAWKAVAVRPKQFGKGFTLFGAEPDKWNMSDAPQLLWGIDTTKAVGDGQFSGMVNITLYQPPGNNYGLTTGRYSVEPLAGGDVKIGISVKNDKCELNGTYVVPKDSIATGEDKSSAE